MKLKFDTYKSIDENQILNLYKDANWTAYTDNLDSLLKGIKNSLDVISVWNEDKLVGLIRTIGDGETIIYIQDILVLKNYKRKGIGRELMNHILEKYKLVRQVVLLTDDNPESRGFYERIGFESYDKGGVVAFGKQ